ncbi:hypothetical protein PG22506_1225 [Bifidobacterium pseudolongum subsp. globosum]|nr:hypothetical protein PG22506_1225 [Bifidobacterium pseudolongum subsp. globosum]
MRGKLNKTRVDGTIRRIIPAHAGQTRIWRSMFFACADHPRACGANKAPIVADTIGAGSSPRMRGKRRAGRAVTSHRRIIPAHAGQTGRLESKHFQVADHPRACGANCRSDIPPHGGIGSSPRMRGKLFFDTALFSLVRIIPAHAGQTIRLLLLRVYRSDHPRACGANAAHCGKPAFGYGSSPRMRGKRAQQAGEYVRHRIIPAHAGQTRFRE